MRTVDGARAEDRHPVAGLQRVLGPALAVDQARRRPKMATRRARTLAVDSDSPQG
jgi:hypothetical protein